MWGEGARMSTNVTMSREQIQAKRAALREKLKALRTKLACTQPELAEAIDVPYSYVNLIENRSGSCNVQRAEAVVKKAYQQFGAPYEDISAMQQMTLAGFSRNAPAEIDPEIAGRGATRSETARRINAFKDEFRLRPPQLAQIFGVSGGHEYVLRTGKDNTSLEIRKKVLAIIDHETAKRRNSVPPRLVAPPVQPTVVASAPVPSVVASTDTVMSPAVLVYSAAALHTAIDFDFKTKHQFSKLPDGTILVVKGA